MKYQEDRLMQRFKTETNSNIIVLLIVLRITVALLAGIASIALRFANPELTETQFFIEYWWLWLGAAAVLLLMTLIGKWERRRKWTGD